MEIVSSANDLLEFGMLKTAKRPAKRPVPPLWVGEWIDALKFDREDVAAEVDLDRSYISNLSGGVVRPEPKNATIAALLAIANHIGCTVNDFLIKPPTLDRLSDLRDVSPKAAANLVAAQSRPDVPRRPRGRKPTKATKERRV